MTFRVGTRSRHIISPRSVFEPNRILLPFAAVSFRFNYNTYVGRWVGCRFVGNYIYIRTDIATAAHSLTKTIKRIKI